MAAMCTRGSFHLSLVCDCLLDDCYFYMSTVYFAVKHYYISAKCFRTLDLLSSLFKECLKNVSIDINKQNFPFKETQVNSKF